MSGKRIRNILELSQQERKEFLDSFDCVLTDCDGVLWTVFEPLPGIGPALTALQSHGKRLRFITNNSVRSLESYSTALHTLGITLNPADLIHPAKSIAEHLRAINFRGLIYCVATESFKGVLREAGFEVTDGPHDPLEESFKKIIATVNDRAPVRAVIVDVDFNVNYPKLLRAEFYLKRDPECLLIAGATDKVLNVGRRDQVNLIGPGHFLEVLERSTGRKATVLGKPGEALAKQILSGHRDSRRVLMVGDMMEQDVAFGTRCGFQRLLVLSGGTTREDMMRQADAACVPDYCADSLVDLGKLVE